MKLPFRSRVKPSQLGLDIGTTAVKLLALSRQGEQLQVEGFAIEPLPVGAVVDKRIEDPAQVAAAIRRAQQRCQCHQRSAVTAVAGSAVMSRIITLPTQLSERDLEQQVMLEAGQYIPHPLSEVSIDFHLIGATADAADRNDILLAASRTENVDMRIDALEQAGLRTAVVEIESNAVLNPLPLLGVTADQVIALFDIGATVTTLTVVQGRRSRYSREQPFGGRQLTEQIQRRYGMNQAEAQQAKRHGDGLPDSYQQELLTPYRESLLQQLVRSLQLCFSATTLQRVDRVILAGGGAALPQLSERLAAQLQMPVTLANPFTSMALASNIDNRQLSHDAPLLLVACGLALRDLQPDDDR